MTSTVDTLTALGIPAKGKENNKVHTRSFRAQLCGTENQHRLRHAQTHSAATVRDQERPRHSLSVQSVAARNRVQAATRDPGPRATEKIWPLISFLTSLTSCGGLRARKGRRRRRGESSFWQRKKTSRFNAPARSRANPEPPSHPFTPASAGASWPPRACYDQIKKIYQQCEC